MKKLLSLASIVALFIIFASVVNADISMSELFDGKEATNAGSYAKLLNDYDNSWGYGSYDVIEGTVGENRLSVKTPVINDGDGFVIENYRVFFSPYRIEALKTLSSDVDLTRIMMKDVRFNNDDSTEFTFDISPEEDGINPEIGYYGVIVPLDMYNLIGAPSKEICFKLSSNTFKRDSACDSLEGNINPTPAAETTANPDVSAAINSTDTAISQNTTEEHAAAPTDITASNGEHGAACVGMDLANVSHTVNGDELTLTWTAIDGDTVEVAVFDPEDEIYKRLGAVNMNAEKFVYKMQWNGEQNFMLTNGCKEVYYKADAAIKSKPTIVPAATGPAENILYIAIASIVLYGSYVLFRKSDNK